MARRDVDRRLGRSRWLTLDDRRQRRVRLGEVLKTQDLGDLLYTFGTMNPGLV